MIAFLALTMCLGLPQAGDFFSVEIYDNAGTELPPDKDWLSGGAASLGDVDGDAIDDIEVWVLDTTDLRWESVVLFMNADGSVRASHDVPLPGSVLQVGFLNMQFFPPYAIGDVNQDGVPDLGSVALGGMNVIELTSTGDVLAINTLSLSCLVERAAVAGDIDGNGIDDLVTSNETILFLGANGVLLSEVDITPSTNSSFHSATGLGDLDLDGVPDVAMGGSNGSYSIHLLNADGTARQTVVHNTNFGRGSVSVDAFDLDGDGRKELSAVDSTQISTSRVTTVFLNSGGGIASTGTVNTPQDVPSSLFWGCRVEYHSDGRLLVGTASSLDLITLVPKVIPAAATSRNAGTNLASLGCVDPVLGSSITLSLDAGASGHSMGILLGFDSPTQFTLPGGQTVLIADLLGSGELVNTGFFPGPVAQIPLTIPNDIELLGFPLSIQGVSAMGTIPFALSNACDLVIGF